MRLPPILVASGLLFAAAACATPPAGVAPVESASSGPLPIEGHDWFLNGADEEPTLVYGVADSDDVWFVLSCERPGKLTLLQPAAEPHAILVESGGDTETYATTQAPSELHDLLLSAQARADDPVMQRFRRLGWLATWTDGQRAVMVPHPGSEPRIETFFAACD